MASDASSASTNTCVHSDRFVLFHQGTSKQQQQTATCQADQSVEPHSRQHRTHTKLTGYRVALLFLPSAAQQQWPSVPLSTRWAHTLIQSLSATVITSSLPSKATTLLADSRQPWCSVLSAVAARVAAEDMLLIFLLHVAICDNDM